VKEKRESKRERELERLKSHMQKSNNNMIQDSEEDVRESLLEKSKGIKGNNRRLPLTRRTKSFIVCGLIGFGLLQMLLDQFGLVRLPYVRFHRPEWEKKDQEEDTYGTQNPLGTHPFTHCYRYYGCQLHYSPLDLARVAKEELLEQFLPSLMQYSQYPKPKYTRHLRTQSNKQFAILTRGGFKEQITRNEDRILEISPMLLHRRSAKSDFFIALFDGHGEHGSVIAHYAAMEAPRLFKEKILKTGLENALVKETIAQALHETVLAVDKTAPKLRACGSTAILAYKSDKNLFISNTGDSTAFVVQYDSKRKNSTIIYKNKPHKPDDPDEKQRIEERGGEILMPENGQDEGARLVIKFPDVQDHEMTLAMSRSIGDVNGKSVGLIADPTIDVLRIDPRKQLFIVLASDGMMDMVSDFEIAQHVGKSMFGYTTRTLLESLEQLIWKASEGWVKESTNSGTRYRDDISIVVRKL